MIVAIDGPAGSGKGTITEIVSKELNLVNISSGGAYRCVALLAIQNNLEVAQKEEILNILNNSKIEFKNEEFEYKNKKLKGLNININFN